jgi:hypothetical protein
MKPAAAARTVFAVGAKVLWHGKPATVLSSHRNGKTYGILTDTGKSTFTKYDALKEVTA